MARSFTTREKETIKCNLLESCKKSWSTYGYKKTNVDELCKQAGISKGAFYLFYPSKEALFCEALCSMQAQICHGASKIIEERQDKQGMAEALKFIYREYDKNHFLYHSGSMDFTILKNKLSEEQIAKIEESEQMCKQLFSNQPGLKLKIPTDLALSIIYTLIMNAKNKDILPHDHIETFDFMADHLIGCLYE